VNSAIEMLRRVSWHAERLFKHRGHFRVFLWLTEDAQGHRQMFETACQVSRAEVTDTEALAALRDELADDLRRDGVVAYACAFAASATSVLWPSVLHLKAERIRHE
jgi:hypothetical protein